MMDKTALKIINLLQENCKISTRDLGKSVGLTAPAVAERIHRLKESGVIEGFHAQINESLLGNNITAFVQVNVPPREYEHFCRFCLDEPSITEHHHIVGYNNVLLKIRVANSSALDHLLEQIRKYGLSNTSVVLSTYFTRKHFPQREKEEN